MAVGHLGLILTQVFIYQVTSSYAQYIQYAGTSLPVPYVYPVQGYAPSPFYQPVPSYQPASVPYQAPTLGAASAPKHVPIPANAVTPMYQPTAYQASPLQQPIKASPVTPTSSPHIAQIVPIPDPKLQPIQPISAPRVMETLPDKAVLPKDLIPTTQPFDSNVLNNLAIALQLLIVSNLIHNPPPDSNSSPILDEDTFPTVAPLPIAFVPPSVSESSYFPTNNQIPNANFIGTTSFGDTGISKSMMNAYGSPTLPASRSTGLMSPYDAIGPNSPYREVFQAKPEPKSYMPTDLFSLTELFKI